MTKKKVVLLVCLLVFALLLVLNGTVFVVQEITVTEYMTSGQTDLDKQDIAELAGMKGLHVLTISEDKAIENIETNKPYVKVEDIVRVSPWHVEIVVSTRVELIAVKNKNAGYAIVDKECRVLQNVETLGNREITIFEGVSTVSAKPGQILDIGKEDVDKLVKIIDSFEYMGTNGFCDKNFCKAVANIKFLENNEVKITLAQGAVLYFEATDVKDKLFAYMSFMNDNESARESGVYLVKLLESATSNIKYEVFVAQ